MNHAIQLRPQLRNVKRLRDVVGAHARGFDGAFNRAELRKYDNRNMRIQLPGSLQEFDSAQLGNLQIGDDDINEGLIEDFEGLLRGGRGAGSPAAIGDYITAQPADLLLIVYDQD